MLAPRDDPGTQLHKVDSERVLIGVETYARVGYGEGTYYTMSGPVEVMRPLYRQLGARNAKVVDAIALRTGAIGDGWLPASLRRGPRYPASPQAR